MSNKLTLRAEAGGWVGQVTRLTTIYYSSYVQQQRKEKQKTWNENKKIPWTSKASSTKYKPRKKQKKNDVTGVAKIIHPYKKENKQNKNTHTHNVTPKNYRETAVLIGICVDFCLCLNSTRFPLNVILWRSSPPRKQRKNHRPPFWRRPKKTTKKYWFHHLSSYAFLQNFSSYTPYIHPI